MSDLLRYLLVPEAQFDLEQLLDYIAEDNIDAALKVHERFLKVFHLLAENPEIGHFRDDLTSKPIRFYSVYSYLVVYIADATPLQIVRVLGSRQDIAKALH